ncbi:MAG TPA: hypothetical protein VF019_04820, partial [Nitrospira sp.]
MEQARLKPERGKKPSVMQSRGSSAPLGATVTSSGVNFSLYSRDAAGIELLLFNQPDDAKPSHIIALDSESNRSYHYWHIFLSDLQAG